MDDQNTANNLNTADKTVKQPGETQINSVPGENTQQVVNDDSQNIPSSGIAPPAPINSGQSTLQNEPSPSIPQVPDETIPTEAVNIPPSSVSVIAPPHDKGLPVWFYLLFILVVILFISITALLITTFINNQKSTREAARQQLTPAVNPEASVAPTSVPSPTPIDAIVVSMKKLSSEDDVQTIEKELLDTDLSSFQENLKNLDSLMGATSK